MNAKQEALFKDMKKNRDRAVKKCPHCGEMGIIAFAPCGYCIWCHVAGKCTCNRRKANGTDKNGAVDPAAR